MIERGGWGLARAACCAAILLAAATAARGDTLVAPGATWKYLDNGTDQGTAWRATGFADAAWASGPAQLGYGDGDEITTVDCSPNAPGVCGSGNNYITTYFRHSFNVVNPALYTNMTLWTLLDDGAVVYINGFEVFRANITTGAVAFNTAATAALADNFQRTVVISPSLLVAGTNVIAVEVHQSAATSSDMSFDASLVADNAPATTLIGAAGTTGAWKYLADGSNQGTAWTGTGFIDTAWPSGNGSLGYGDPQTTVINCGPSAPTCNAGNFVTTYFRKTFNVASPGIYTSLLLRLRRDDGAVVYLNGTEIHRANMPTGAIAFNTLSPVAVGGADETTYFPCGIDPYTLPPSLLLTGNNVLAVEIHQNATTSTDVSFDAELIGIQGLPTVTRGPYLQMGTPNSVIVRWRTNAATNSRVRHGAAPGSLTTVVDDATATTEHIVTLTGLLANTTYYYSVGTSTSELAGNDANHFFVTSPTHGSTKDTRIWVLGDSGTANANAQAVRNAYYAFTGARHTDLWLMLGDNAYNSGFDAEFQAAVFDMYPTMLRKSVLWPTLGNHETYNGSTFSSPAPAVGPYYSIFSLPTNAEAGGTISGTEAYYSFDYANIHFICLDSMDVSRLPAGAMLTWLASDIAATSQRWIICFFHHPPYTKGSHDSDTEIELVEMRQHALPILEAGGVDLVLAGHSHSYERSYLIDGHDGVSSTFEVPPGSHLVDGGDGRPTGDGAYTKTTGPNKGAVYAVPGSSGQISGGALNHPAMFISLNQLGSMILDVNGSQLDAIFLNSAGVQADTFTIIKTTPTPTFSPTPSISPSQTISLTPTVSPTFSPTPSSTASLTPTVSQTASISPTVSPTPTISLTPSVSPSETASPAGSPTASLTPSDTPMPSFSPSPSGTGSLTPTATMTPTPTPTAPPTASPTSNASRDWSVYE